VVQYTLHSVCVSGGGEIVVCVSGGGEIVVCVSGGGDIVVCVSGGGEIVVLTHSEKAHKDSDFTIMTTDIFV